jgi:hypothetical protein
LPAVSPSPESANAANRRARALRASPRNEGEGGQSAMIAVATLWLLCLGLFLDLAADAPTLEDV